jgi:predicted acyl esterase
VGYAVVVVVVAGRSKSRGAVIVHYDRPLGVAVIEWIARQPWCDGCAAMIVNRLTVAEHPLILSVSALRFW